MEGVGGELCLTLHCQGHLHNNDLRIKIGSSMSRFKCFIFFVKEQGHSRSFSDWISEPQLLKRKCVLGDGSFYFYFCLFTQQTFSDSVQMGHCAPRYAEFINYSLHPVVLVYYFTDTGSGTMYSMVC